jgi:hypothetical protein
MARELRIHERPSSLERPSHRRHFADGTTAAGAPRSRPATSRRLWGAKKFADIDPELFVDFQATRPMVSLEEGRTRKIEWPENTFYRARIPGADRDAILLVGVEPNYRWRTFSEIVTDLARELGVELAVTLGALVADVPHTRPSTGHGRCDGSAARRRARPAALALRGPDRNRRRASRLVPSSWASRP